MHIMSEKILFTSNDTLLDLIKKCNDSPVIIPQYKIKNIFNCLFLNIEKFFDKPEVINFFSTYYNYINYPLDLVSIFVYYKELGQLQLNHNKLIKNSIDREDIISTIIGYPKYARIIKKHISELCDTCPNIIKTNHNVFYDLYTIKNIFIKKDNVKEDHDHANLNYACIIKMKLGIDITHNKDQQTS